MTSTSDSNYMLEVRRQPSHLSTYPITLHIAIPKKKGTKNVNIDRYMRVRLWYEFVKLPIAAEGSQLQGDAGSDIQHQNNQPQNQVTPTDPHPPRMRNPSFSVLFPI